MNQPGGENFDIETIIHGDQDPDWLVRAHDIAREAHSGQMYDETLSYMDGHIYPALRLLVGMGYVGACDRGLLLLHDVIEDTDVTLNDLEKAEMPSFLLKGLIVISKSPGEPYDGYKQRMIDNAVAVPCVPPVKLADASSHINYKLERTLREPDWRNNIEIGVAKYAGVVLKMSEVLPAKIHDPEPIAIAA